MLDRMMRIAAGPPKEISTQLPLLEARDVTFAAGKTPLVKDLNLTIEKGTKTIIMGANGAGKSLTLRLLHGLIDPTAGQVAWHGASQDSSHSRATRSQATRAQATRAQAMVFQRPVMLRRSVLANLDFALSVRGIRGAAKAEKARTVLAWAQLEDLAHRPARSLSGGEQQRLAIARALAGEPEILFLDEPTASLDPASTKAIEELIHTAHRRGVTIVMVTHDLGQARRIAGTGGRLAFLAHGRLVETATLEDCLAAPQSEALKAWLEGRLYLDR